MLSVLILPDDAFARRKTYSKRSIDFTKSSKYASLVVDATTGDVISKVNPNKQLYPASLTKIMTLYLTFEAIESGKLQLHQLLPVSAKAARMPKTNLNLRKGQRITVRDAIMGLIIRSANDAAVVLAEAISGSEAKFALEMTNTAKQLGMDRTTFKNASGLPDSMQVTTAYDMARLAIAIRRDHPRFYPLFSKKSFKFKNAIITHHNKVLDKYPWADGLKTGYTNASGYNLITSTNSAKGKLVGVVLGGSSSYARDTHMIALLNKSYSRLDEIAVAKKSKSPFSFMFDTAEADNKLSVNRGSNKSALVSSASIFDAVDSGSHNYVTKANLVVEDPFKLADSKVENAPIKKTVRKKVSNRKKVGTTKRAKLKANKKKKTSSVKRKSNNKTTIAKKVTKKNNHSV